MSAPALRNSKGYNEHIFSYCMYTEDTVSPKRLKRTRWCNNDALDKKPHRASRYISTPVLVFLSWGIA